MYRIIFAIFLLKTVATFGQAQEKTCGAMLDTLTGLSVYRVPTEMPGYPGGMEGVVKQILKRVIVPKVDGTIGGFKVFVAFIVQTDGAVVGQRVVRNVPGTNLGEQVLDVVEDVRWKPGTCNGKEVPTILLLPIAIKTAW